MEPAATRLRKFGNPSSTSFPRFQARRRQNDHGPERCDPFRAPNAPCYKTIMRRVPLTCEPEGSQNYEGAHAVYTSMCLRRRYAQTRSVHRCENPVTRLGIEPGSPWWEASVLITQPPWPHQKIVKAANAANLPPHTLAKCLNAFRQSASCNFLVSSQPDQQGTFCSKQQLIRHHSITATNKQTIMSRVYRELSSLTCCQLNQRNSRGSTNRTRGPFNSLALSPSDEGEGRLIWTSAGMKGRGETGGPEKTRRPAVSSLKIPICEIREQPGLALVGNKYSYHYTTAAPQSERRRRTLHMTGKARAQMGEGGVRMEDGPAELASQPHPHPPPPPPTPTPHLPHGRAAHVKSGVSRSISIWERAALKDNAAFIKYLDACEQRPLARGRACQASSEPTGCVEVTLSLSCSTMLADHWTASSVLRHRYTTCFHLFFWKESAWKATTPQHPPGCLLTDHAVSTQLTNDASRQLTGPPCHSELNKVFRHQHLATLGIGEASSGARRTILRYACCNSGVGARAGMVRARGATCAAVARGEGRRPGKSSERHVTRAINLRYRPRRAEQLQPARVINTDGYGVAAFFLDPPAGPRFSDDQFFSGSNTVNRPSGTPVDASPTVRYVLLLGLVGMHCGRVWHWEHLRRKESCYSKHVARKITTARYACIKTFVWRGCGEIVRDYCKQLRKLNTMSAYTRQKAKSKYRHRIRLERASHKPSHDRVKRCWERKINIEASERVNVRIEQRQNARVGEQELPKKTLQPATFSDTISTCGNPGVAQDGNGTQVALVHGKQSNRSATAAPSGLQTHNIIFKKESRWSFERWLKTHTYSSALRIEGGTSDGVVMECMGGRNWNTHRKLRNQLQRRFVVRGPRAMSRISPPSTSPRMAAPWREKHEAMPNDNGEKKSAMACTKEPFQHSPRVISGNHGKSKSGSPYQDPIKSPRIHVRWLTTASPPAQSCYSSIWPITSLTFYGYYLQRMRTISRAVGKILERDVTFSKLLTACLNGLGLNMQAPVSMEQRRDKMTGEMGDPRENPPTSGIVRHDSHMRKSGIYPTGNRTQFG
ncbi:hypothetical protein PR048_026715 [Dryococelus australis]|uniref:Uncharacterized protein n=1 Tax=Dryococelus australis TaxID=614101 RepID=A0ABQ9GM63_9NEOP|nr:hypothetical protein PR048_026715 [Dryococelus australis]